MIISPQRQAAAELGRRLANGWKREEGMFTLRDVYRNEWSGLASPDAVRRVLPLLEDAGWVRPAELDVAKGQAEPAERIVPGQPQATTEDEMSTSRWLHWTPKEASIIRKTSEPEPTKPTELNFVSFVSAPRVVSKRLRSGSTPSQQRCSRTVLSVPVTPCTGRTMSATTNA